MGSGMVQVWVRSGSDLVQVWFRFGSGLVQVWFRFGLRLVQVWFRFGCWGSGWFQIRLLGFRVGSGWASGFLFTLCWLV